MTYILEKNEEAVFMNKLCVVARNQETYFMKRLTAEVGNVLIWNPWGSEILPQAHAYLVRTTGVYGDDRDLDQLRPCENVFNPVRTHELLRDKARQFEMLERRGFHLIPWRTLDQRGDFLPEKILLKPIRGQGGWGIQVMKQEEFLDWEKKTTDRSWIVQPYLENVKEFRLFFCDHEEFLLERTGEVAANFNQGGEAKLVSLPPELSELGEDIRNATGAVFGAVDFFQVGSQQLILEVNPVPGIEQLEKVTGLNIVKKVLSCLKS
jgi:glutathione synthase/RimK-type ligase-like ATP-grasp enzyme